jgi:hypothetical protein
MYRDALFGGLSGILGGLAEDGCRVKKKARQIEITEPLSISIGSAASGFAPGSRMY